MRHSTGVKMMSEPSDQPVDRVFMVLEAVARADRPSTISEIAVSVGLPAPTVHRLVAQLIGRGHLKRAVGSKRVLPAPRLIEFGAGILQGAMLLDRPHAILVGLAQEILEDCQIGIVADGEVLYVDTARADHISGLHFRPGRRAPLHCTSIGKLFLAYIPGSQFENWLSGANLWSLTERTISKGEDLRRSLEDVRQQGWSYSGEEYILGVSGCAVPIRVRNRFVAGLGVAAPAVRFDIERARAIEPRLKDAAQAISQALEQVDPPLAHTSEIVSKSSAQKSKISSVLSKQR
jgi:IclR family transcriptional regulator, acetate operon repressor